MLNEPPLDWINYWCNEVKSLASLDRQHSSTPDKTTNDNEMSITIDTNLESTKEEPTDSRTLADDYKHSINITIQPGNLM
jgi:hypothetical protein